MLFVIFEKLLTPVICQWILLKIVSDLLHYLCTIFFNFTLGVGSGFNYWSYKNENLSFNTQLINTITKYKTRKFSIKLSTKQIFIWKLIVTKTSHP